MRTIESWKQKAKSLKVDLYALFLSYRDPEVPWYGKVLILVLIAYAFSPIDLIPDFIPVLGYLDDLILLPLGILLVIKMVPPEIIERNRRKAEMKIQDHPKNWFGAALIVCIWMAVIFWVSRYF